MRILNNLLLGCCAAIGPIATLRLSSCSLPAADRQAQQLGGPDFIRKFTEGPNTCAFGSPCNILRGSYGADAYINDDFYKHDAPAGANHSSYNQLARNIYITPVGGLDGSMRANFLTGY